MLFSSEVGKRIYSDFLRIIDDFSMEEKIRGGVLVGFSGGADSVMLLSSLVRFVQSKGYPMPVAVHLNHGIRGEEADRDEAFSRDFSMALNVEFVSFLRDIPGEAKR